MLQSPSRDSGEAGQGSLLLGLGCGTATLPISIKKTSPEVEVVRIGGDLEILEIARKSVRSSVFGLICFMVMSDGPYKPGKERLVLEVENKSAKTVLQKVLGRVWGTLKAIFHNPSPYLFSSSAAPDLYENQRRKESCRHGTVEENEHTAIA